MFLTIIELFKLKSGKWSRQFVLFFQFLSIRCSLNNSETRERELIPNKIPGVTFPRPPLQACFLGPSLIGSRSALFYPRYVPDQLGTNSASGRGGT